MRSSALIAPGWLADPLVTGRRVLLVVDAPAPDAHRHVPVRLEVAHLGLGRVRSPFTLVDQDGRGSETVEGTVALCRRGSGRSATARPRSGASVRRLVLGRRGAVF